MAVSVDGVVWEEVRLSRKVRFCVGVRRARGRSNVGLVRGDSGRRVRTLMVVIALVEEKVGAAGR